MPDADTLPPAIQAIILDTDTRLRYDGGRPF